MARPFKKRKIKCDPEAYYFKPRGVPLFALRETVLKLDEFEALRLCDYQGKEHSAGAASMGVSRQTFTNIINSARKKTASAIINGNALRIEGEKAELPEISFKRRKNENMRTCGKK
ncbi:MAG: hypothetical protein COT17_05690 [Elusimicrobia bacterium CG08_land_8_20_14_0_20_51_18]|nr:MAG: hypothetical protein COT17_05690 [Elusimicrobia bacterium CG08_land_8_20_14_0_20_51_18]